MTWVKRGAELILQAFSHFTYVTANSPTLSWLYLRHSSFSNPSVALPTSQLIFQPFPLLHLRYRSFSNHSFASPTSQALHLLHPASRPWFFHAPSNQCNLLFIFCFLQEKQLSFTETIKYEINKYMFKFIIFNFFFCCSEITNLKVFNSSRWTPLVTSAVLKSNYPYGTVRT